MSKKLSVVCLGSCDMYPTYGFVGGLKEAGVKVTSYGESINTVHSLLYHIERVENRDTIHNADLIILGSGSESNDKNLVSLYKILYKKLWKLNKKTVVCIWNHVRFDNELEYFHHKQCESYGFNLINVRKYCREKEIFTFYTSYHDFYHPFYSFMSGISKRIIKEFDKLQLPRCLDTVRDKTEFTIIPFAEFIDKARIKKTRTFTRYENIYKLENNQGIQIPPKYQNYTLIGIHMMNVAVNNFTVPKNITTFILKNKTKKVLVHARSFNYITPINTNDFIIDNETYLQRAFDDTIEKLKPQFPPNRILENANLGLIALLLIKDNSCLEDQEIDYDENFKLSSRYDFAYILDFLIEGKKFIEDYNKRQDPVKLAESKKQIEQKDVLINSLSSQIQALSMQYPNSAVARIHNHLAYKLGQVLIINSKSILGYIRMPFILSFIKEQHKIRQLKFEKALKENPNLALPPLKSYVDYKEALKEKECFTYKLGEAFIKAHKNWYKGGYLKFYFKDMPRIKKEVEK